MILYNYARNLAHTEMLIDKLIKIDYPLGAVLPEGLDEQSDKAKKELRDLTAHRMMLLSEMAAACGFKLVPFNER